jgi:putative membrane protein insertion efficiency factor
MKTLVIIFIKFYQYTLSPLTGQNCRFYPTCSAYAIQAVSTYGCVKGGFLAVKRILRCHPFHAGGFDPVP